MSFVPIAVPQSFERNTKMTFKQEQEENKQIMAVQDSALSGAAAPFVPKPKIPTGPRIPTIKGVRYGAFAQPLPRRSEQSLVPRFQELVDASARGQPYGAYQDPMMRWGASTASSSSSSEGRALPSHYYNYALAKYYAQNQPQGQMPQQYYNHEHAAYQNPHKPMSTPMTNTTAPAPILRGIPFSALPPGRQVPLPSFYRNPLPLPASVPAPLPKPITITPAKPPKTQLLRRDKSKKDIIISAKTIYRNTHEVATRYLPNDGVGIDTFNDIFAPPCYDFLEDWKGMSGEQKREFLGKNKVEIRVKMPVDFDQHGDGIRKIEGVNGAMEHGEYGDEVKVLEASLTTLAIEDKVDEKTKAEFAVHTHNSRLIELPSTKASLVLQPVANGQKRDRIISSHHRKHEPRTVLTTLSELPKDFFLHTTNLTITLIFPTDPDISPLTQPIQLAPLHGAPTTNPTYLLLESLVYFTDSHFTSLSSLTINLSVPSNTRMPLSIPQLYMVLPFYDLRFQKWRLTYQPDSLTRGLAVEGWCVVKLDQERERVVRVRRQEEREEMIKVRERERGVMRASQTRGLVFDIRPASKGGPRVGGSAL